MAFHVACPITCRKICFCSMGFTGRLRTQEGMKEFMQDVAMIEQFLNDPWSIKSRDNASISVLVPKVVVSPLPQESSLIPPLLSDEGTALKAAALAQMTKTVLQKQARASSSAAEDYVKFEGGDLVTSSTDVDGDGQDISNGKVMCRICFTGENGGEKARKMLPCSTCGKKYHRNCLKRWSQNRDLFHWSSWTCPSCRMCEVCQKTGDPSKFMFCRRCDGAYHCYCQQPPHKNVGHGPYLCPKHTRCHSCGSSVPGNGLSVRWFLGYTCCDACGRLFVKGNFCPVCLKVYRDSESTPMVCCDICQRWVHCPCDGISDAKYMEFQVDGNLQYICPTCRGECSQVRSFEEAVQELWRRRDEADKDLVASLRAAAGLPTQEEIFDISPFSDDEDNGPGPAVSKIEYGRSLKLSLKGLSDNNSPNKSKENGKKSLNKKKSIETDIAFGNQKNEDVHFLGALSPATGSFSDVNETNRKFVEDVTVTNTLKTIKIKSNKSSTEEPMTAASGRKLVIHLGGRNRSTSSPPKTEAAVSVKSSQDLTSSGVAVHKKEGRLIKLKKVKVGGELADANYVSQTVVGKKVAEESSQVKVKKKNKSSDDNDSSAGASVSQASTFLKFKIPKNTSNDGIVGLGLDGKDELSYTRGQRSKRKRPAIGDEDMTNASNTMNDFTDANWVLQKLGKDAVGKRVEVHYPSTDSWHRGSVVQVLEDASSVSVAMDDGKTKSFELGKQGIRFVSQKRK